MNFSTSSAPVGDSEGELTVVYEDAFGNEGSFTSPVRVTVEEPKPIITDPGSKETGKASTPWVWIILCGVLSLAFIVQGILLQNKIHRLEEDRL